MSETVKARDLKLADRIQLFEGDYGTGTVYNIDAGQVFVVRPYIHTSDFSHTGGVSWYAGFETVKLWLDSDREVVVIQRGGPIR